MSKYYVEVGGHEIGLEITQGSEATEIRTLDDGHAEAILVDLAHVHSNIETGEGLYSLIIGGKSYQLSVTRTDSGLDVIISGHRVELRVLTEREWRLERIAPKHAHISGPITIISPMPGLVKAVLVAPGDTVHQGDRLLVLEAMKMENEITASRDGRITEVLVDAGTIVEGGRTLITLE